MEEMTYEIRHLPAAGYDDDGNPEPEREMDNKIALDDHEPTGDEINSLWEKQTEGEIEAESKEEALSQLWNAYDRSPAGYNREMDEKEMRSLRVNDIIVLNSTVYLCESIGWKEIGIISTQSHAGTPMGDA